MTRTRPGGVVTAAAVVVAAALAAAIVLASVDAFQAAVHIQRNHHEHYQCHHRRRRQQPRGTSSSWTTSVGSSFVGSNSQSSLGRLPLALNAVASSNDGGNGNKKKAKRKVKTKTKAKTQKCKVKKTVEEEKEEEEKTAVVAVAADSATDNMEEVEEENEKEVDDDDDDDDDVTTSTSTTTYYGPNPQVPDILDFDLTGGRPGSIIESEADLQRKAEMMEELQTGERGDHYPQWFEDYGRLEEDISAKYDTDDPDAIDASTLGQYDITDLNTHFDWEWDPAKGDPDPNHFVGNDDGVLSLSSQIKDGHLGTGRYLQETPKDEDGIEIGFTSMFGTANPIDTRTELGLRDSYMIDQRTRDETMLTPEFPQGDLEIAYNEEVVNFRKSIDIIDTYTDEFLGPNMSVPRYAAKWYGYPEQTRYPPQNYTNNRFTDLQDLTNFDALTPHRARQKAVELARAKNAEWMPDGVSQAWHTEQRRPYEERTVGSGPNGGGTLVGTTRKGECDPEVVEAIRPALKILGSCAILLSIEQGTVFRFHYHGLMKNRYGMSCWTETLIRDCGVEVTGVVFETGFRARDPFYDGGDPYHGWN